MFDKKPEVAEDDNDDICLSSQSPTKKFYISYLCFLCHLQTRSMGMVVVFVKFPIWGQHFNSILDPILITAKAAIQVYIFFRCPFEVSIMSSHFGPQDAYADIKMTKLHPPIFQSYASFSSTRTDLDPSMTMPVYTVESNPSEANHCT